MVQTSNTIGSLVTRPGIDEFGSCPKAIAETCWTPYFDLFATDFAKTLGRVLYMAIGHPFEN